MRGGGWLCISHRVYAYVHGSRFDSDVVLYNEAAKSIVDSFIGMGAKITTVDLYNFVLQRCGGKGYKTCPGFQLPANVHYTPAGWTALAQVMSEAVLAELIGNL